MKINAEKKYIECKTVMRVLLQAQLMLPNIFRKKGIPEDEMR